MYESSERRWSTDFQVGGDGYPGSESLESNWTEAVIRTSQWEAFKYILGVFYERSGLMSDSKCQRLDAISDRDQMAEKPPTEEASRRFRTPACYSILGYSARQKAKRNKIDTGAEIGRGAGSENRERTEEGIPPEL